MPIISYGVMRTLAEYHQTDNVDFHPLFRGPFDPNLADYKRFQQKYFKTCRILSLTRVYSEAET